MTQLPSPNKKRFWKKAWFWILIIVVALIIVVSVFSMNAAQESKRKSLSYLEQTVQVSEITLERTISSTGVVAVDHAQSVTPLVTGTVKEVRVAVGDLVTRDQVLFTIDAPLASTAQKEVKAPFDGRVLSIDVFRDGLVTPGVPAMVIGYRSTHVEFLASDAEVVELANDQRAHLSIPAINNGRDVYEAVVSFVDVQKSMSTTTLTQQAASGYEVHVTTDNLSEAIRNRSGLVVDIEIITDTKAQALSVDRSAIQYDDEDKPFVYRAPELTDAFYQQAMITNDITSVLEKVSITTGFEGDDAIEVTSGLKRDDKVLLYVPKETSTSPF